MGKYSTKEAGLKENICTKLVIACHEAHIYKWLNLLPEPKRNLQRFGFVHSGG